MRCCAVVGIPTKWQRHWRRSAAAASDCYASSSAYRKVAELPEPLLQPLALKSVLVGVERLLAPALDQGNISYGSTVSPPDLTVRADPDLLEQALINLLRNAAEAVGGQSGADINVIGGLDGAMCFIEIADNGSGLRMRRVSRFSYHFLPPRKAARAWA